MGCSIHSNEKHAKPRIFTVRPSRLIQDTQTPINEIYEFGPLIGEGTYGSVFFCTHKIKLEKKIVKVIPKLSVKGTKVRSRFINEISSLKTLQHPNLIRLIEFFEDDKTYFIIAEHVTGGDLLEHVLKSKSVSEQKIKVYMKQIFEALNFMHSKGVVYKDLRLENCLMEAPNSESIKLINFGTSVIAGLTKHLTPTQIHFSYMAPEAFKSKLDYKSDIWSAGVILFILLIGKLPFSGNSSELNLETLLHSNFCSNRWKNLTTEAKTFISKLLNSNPDNRPSAEEALAELWFYSNTSDQCFNDVLEDLRCLRADMKLKRTLFCFIVNEIVVQAEESEFKQAFKECDMEESGKIDLEGLVRVCKIVWGDKRDFEEIRNLFLEIDRKKQGAVDYLEFLIRVRKGGRRLRLERLEGCFQVFGKDAAGKIWPEEIRELLEEYDVDNSGWKRLMEQLDFCVGGIDLKEFKSVMLGALD